MDSKILFVGGSWNLDGGKKSKIVDTFASSLDNVTLYNGGYYQNLDNIINQATNYDIVFWWANVDNDLPKIRNVKEMNYKTMLVSSKRNDNNKYTFQELLQRSFKLKSNLTIEFSRINDKYKMRLFDPLGNIWYEGFDIKECVDKLLERLNYIKNMTRVSTQPSKEIYNNIVIPDKKDFLKIVRDYAYKFTEVIFETEKVERFLGNASFRCPKGFPSFREGNYIFVSKRNVDKKIIGLEEFVPVYKKDEKIYYLGDFKPSVDTPIQLNLYDKLPNINYMIHSHCYIKNAPYTLSALPCGALEEVDEISNLIYNYYSDFNKDFYLINLLGHGSIMMSNSPDKLKDIDIVGRVIPEKVLVKK